ncbi:MAG TPA: prephenate dehydrogenase/arogenate dehydrogenase family protein [Dehalococcoidia bacterium]|nr:prephenate dehydrogenase/arogenate dehydrogenase family protein [Dehalococcoidia bacterium]
MARVAIIGLGLIGGSLGLAIKAGGSKDLEIVGSDVMRRARKKAVKMGAVDSEQSDARKAVREAGLIIVATPPATIGDVFKDIAGDLAPGAAVTDVASTKAKSMAWAKEHLPDYVSYVGCHPMAGKTEAGIEAAEAELFQGRPFAIVPSETATEAAVKSVMGLAQMVGAVERFMTPDEHDHYAAAVSHLPIAVSATLFTMLRRSESWGDFGKMAGPAFRDLTRLISGDPQMNTDIMVTNREQVQHWLDRFILELKEFRDGLDGTEDEIFQHFAHGQINRERFLAGEDLELGVQNADIPDSTAQMASLMMGAKAYERLRKINKDADERAKQPQRRH